MEGERLASAVDFKEGSPTHSGEGAGADLLFSELELRFVSRSFDLASQNFDSLAGASIRRAEDELQAKRR
jgi:hypothetical protein